MRRAIKLGLIALGSATLVLVTSAAVFVARHHDSRAASPSSAEATFHDLQTRFAAQRPLLDMHTRRAEAIAAPATARRLHVFHAVIFDTRGGQRLVEISAPYWFARAFAGRTGEFKWLGQLTFLDDTEFDPEEIRLSLAEIEQRGPGLLVDYRHETGGRFIAWVD